MGRAWERSLLVGVSGTGRALQTYDLSTGTHFRFETMAVEINNFAISADEPGGSSVGNRATLFDSGESLFREISERIRSARERVWIETFLFMPDEVGNATIELLADAARRGCDVVLIFDQIGSHRTNFGAYKPVVEAGGRVAIFNPLPFWRRYGRRFGSFFRDRDHRKIAIIDDVGFCGGHNFSGAYMGPPPQHFYDITIRVEGPCVRDLASVLNDSFGAATGESLRLPEAPPAIEGGSPASVMGLDLTRGVDALMRAFRGAMDDARDEVTMIFAYFVPDAPLCEPIIAAAERGVRIRILTAGANDFPFVRWAAQHTFDRLLKAGIRIYQLQEPILHAKAMVIDSELCMVGSFDLNKFERRNNAEVAMMMRDGGLARGLEDCFLSCLPRSREITREDRQNTSLPARSVEWLSYRVHRI